MWIVISSVLSVLALCASLLAIFAAARNAAHGLELQRRLLDLKPSDPQLLAARLSELEATIEVVANRVKMTRVRNAATHAEKTARDKTDEPDARSDPEAWRAWMNAQLRAPNVKPRNNS